ncbi:TerD family protein [Nocardia sp. NPDC050406]|uniref:TerD family protein n=1 Tax=Nocardia sp. NPDC050406 TaxID=3364318 RepID=UPI0037A2C15C
MKLTRGANVPIAASAVSVGLAGSSEGVDVMALLLAESGKIRSNDDFVFFNAPKHPSGAVTLDGTIEVTLVTVEPEVATIAVVGAVDQGSFRDVHGLTLTIREPRGELVSFEVGQREAVTAMLIGEFYRRDGGWKFRAVGQGWDSGLRGLAEEFGVEVDDEPADPPAPPIGGPEPTPFPAPPPPMPVPASPQPTMAPGWYPSPTDPARLRWFSGTAWTDDFRQTFPADPAICQRCGRQVRVPRFGAPAPCRWCENEVNGFMETWRQQAWQVLSADGPRGQRWDELWVALRFQMINEQTGREALRPLAIAHLERFVAFAFADGEIEAEELTTFHQLLADLRTAVDLSHAAQHLGQLTQRMERGRSLTQVRAGDLPNLHRPDLHLDSGELLHVDVNATQIRFLASGPKHTPGRLVASSKKLRFVGATAGTELPWTKILSIRPEYGTVVIAATTAKGGGTYSVPDAEYVAAVLEGTLRVAKRLVLAPGQRDSRSIPQHVKTAVWQRDGGRCRECSAGEYLELDHIIPWSQGGATSVENLQILCRRCNQEKGARI